jgi:hypothetical protein
MRIVAGLKIFFDEIIAVYENYNAKAFWNTSLIAIYSSLITGVLYILINYYSTNVHLAVSFFSGYLQSSSNTDHYSIADLSMIFYLALIALFSLAFFRQNQETGHISFSVKKLLIGLSLNDFGNVIGIVVIAGVADYLLYFAFYYRTGLDSIATIILTIKSIFYEARF